MSNRIEFCQFTYSWRRAHRYSTCAVRYPRVSRNWPQRRNSSHRRSATLVHCTRRAAPCEKPEASKDTRKHVLLISVCVTCKSMAIRVDRHFATLRLRVALSSAQREGDEDEEEEKEKDEEEEGIALRCALDRSRRLGAARRAAHINERRRNDAPPSRRRFLVDSTRLDLTSPFHSTQNGAAKHKSGRAAATLTATS